LRVCDDANLDEGTVEYVALSFRVPCAAPTGQTAGNFTPTGADLGWTGTVSSFFDIYIVPAGGPVPTGTTTPTVNDVTSNPYTWSGGLPNTTYDWYVREDCGQDNLYVSGWTGANTFTTAPCPPITSLPASEGFEGSWPPLCWTDPETANYGWYNDVAGAPHSGAHWAYCNLAGAELISPQVTLPAEARLVFWYRVQDAGTPQDMAVKIGSTVIHQITGAVNTTYLKVEVSLAAYIGQTISVAFVGQTGGGGGGGGICLDDVMVTTYSNIWTGDVSSAWNEVGNWQAGLVPGLSDRVIIPSIPSGGRFPVIGTGVTAECYNLNIQPGATFTVQTGGTCNVLNP
jgi:hypothetical protein